MTRRYYFLLYFLSLATLALVANFEHAPGYMDADYYQLTGQQLAQGNGFTEPVLWNYLDDPQGLPHPSHAYWMPLASLLAAGSMRVFGEGNFATARVGFILLAAAIAPLSAQLTFSLTKQARLALYSGVLALFSSFYLPYLATTDSFGLSMLLGGLFFLLLIRAERSKFTTLMAFGLGLTAGLMQLARAEGLLWLLIGLWAAWFLSKGKSGIFRVLAGYFLVMGPWLLRNWLTFGTLLSPGAARSLWITNYNELFAYPARQLTAANWLASGWGAILRARLSALGENLLSALTVQGLIFLAPLILWGAWKLRQQISVRIAAAAWFALLIAMSFVFPFSGARGGFFHSGAALQPMAWVLAAVGLQSFVGWGRARRGWQSQQAFGVLAAGALVLALGLSAYVVKVRVVGDDVYEPVWNQSAENYRRAGEMLSHMGISAAAIVLVNNSPGFTLATGLPSIVIPDGGVDASLAAARRYGANILVLEKNHPADLDGLYAHPEETIALNYVGSLDGTYVFFIP